MHTESTIERRQQARPGRPTSPSASRSGFTVVEVLVVMVIMSTILVSITQVLSAARETRDQVHNMHETQLAGPAILDLIESDLRGILTYSLRPAGILRVTSLELKGQSADRIDFLTTTNSKLFELGESRALRADFNEVGYVLRERPGSRDFLELYRREGFSADEDPFKGGRYSFLHDRIKSLQILVYDEDGPDVEPLEDWNLESEPQNELPLRIEIELVIEMAPRLLDPSRAAELAGQLKVHYKRSFRLGNALLLSYQTEPVGRVPDIRPPTDTGAGAGVDLAGDSPFGGLGGGNGPLNGQGFDGSGTFELDSNNPFGGAQSDTISDDAQSIIDLFQGAGGGGGGG
jgi:prepilin-type N-terminal cleavage/methylation domain-containing protein